MQSFVRKEIEWAAQELTKEANRLKSISEMAAVTGIERELYLLKAEQLQSIADRFAVAVANEDKRIMIR